MKIIFITSHLECAIDAFELSVFRYVPKNDSNDRLVTAVADDAKLIELETGKEYVIQAAGHWEKTLLTYFLHTTGSLLSREVLPTAEAARCDPF